MDRLVAVAGLWDCPCHAAHSLPWMLGVVYVMSAVLGIAMLGVCAFCATAAGRNHLSPWWLGSYGALILGFMLLAQTTVPAAAFASTH